MKVPMPEGGASRALIRAFVALLAVFIFASVSAAAKPGNGSAERWVGRVTSEVHNSTYAGSGKVSVKIVADVIFAWDPTIGVYKPTGNWTFTYRHDQDDFTVSASASGAIVPADGSLAINSGQSPAIYGGGGLSTKVIEGIATVKGYSAPQYVAHEIPWWQTADGIDLFVQPDGSIDGSSSVATSWGTMNVRWHFDGELPCPPGIEFLIHPEGYDQWRPTPGADEETPGTQSLPLMLEVTAAGGKPARLRVVRFELDLRDTSREPGIAINTPLAPAAKPAPDLRFLAENGAIVSAEGQSATIPSSNGRTASVKIAAFDGGGWSTLVAEAVLEGGCRLRGHLENKQGPSEILLPKRSPGSKIATSWLIAHGNPRDDADDETTPGNSHQGDGLSAYEEYRGLIAKGSHRVLDPRRKELAIELTKEFSEAGGAAGFSLFKNAANVDVVELRPGELDEDRVVNRNAGNAHILSQHALRLVQGSLPAGEAGENQPTAQKGKTPKDSQRVVIDGAQIEEHVRAQAAAAAAAQVQLPYTAGNYLAATIAHEIAHGVGVDHHGPSSNLPKRTVERHQANFKIYGSNRREIEARPWEIVSAGSQGCESSGDLGCLMAYTDMYQWAYDNKGGLNVYRKLPILPLGTRFCTSDKGTGINDPGPTNPGPSYFGNATWGNCAAKIRVRD
jgi:hypothetical protein